MCMCMNVHTHNVHTSLFFMTCLTLLIVVALETPSLWDTYSSTACKSEARYILVSELCVLNAYDSFLHVELSTGQLKSVVSVCVYVCVCSFE